MTDLTKPSALIHYPEADGQPMSESDATRDYLLYCVKALEQYFQSRRNVYVSGNLFIYYREGDPKTSISPDVFVIFGVPKRKRRSYRAWQEDNKLPSFVLEITSLSTKKQDEEEKPRLYASLGVQEYFQYDPTGDYLTPQLKGRVLVNGKYEPLQLENLADGTQKIYSQVLGLELRLQLPAHPLTLVSDFIPRELRLYDPQANELLLSYQELNQARAEAEQASLVAEQARLAAEQARLDAVVRLLAMGLTVEQVAEALNLPVEQVRALQVG